MNHYLISGFLDISLMTTSYKQMKKGNEEMISISSLPFFSHTFHSPIPCPVPCGAVAAEIWQGAEVPRQDPDRAARHSQPLATSHQL